MRRRLEKGTPGGTSSMKLRRLQGEGVGVGSSGCWWGEVKTDKEPCATREWEKGRRLRNRMGCAAGSGLGSGFQSTTRDGISKHKRARHHAASGEGRHRGNPAGSNGLSGTSGTVKRRQMRRF